MARELRKQAEKPMSLPKSGGELAGTPSDVTAAEPAGRSRSHFRRCRFEARCKMPTSRQQTLGKEFDWFVIDSAGELGACSSAGWGEIPAIVLQQCTLADSPIQHIDR